MRTWSDSFFKTCEEYINLSKIDDLDSREADRIRDKIDILSRGLLEDESDVIDGFIIDLDWLKEQSPWEYDKENYLVKKPHALRREFETYLIDKDYVKAGNSLRMMLLSPSVYAKNNHLRIMMRICKIWFALGNYVASAHISTWLIMNDFFYESIVYINVISLVETNMIERARLVFFDRVNYISENETAHILVTIKSKDKTIMNYFIDSVHDISTNNYTLLLAFLLRLRDSDIKSFLASSRAIYSELKENQNLSNFNEVNRRKLNEHTLRLKILILIGYTILAENYSYNMSYLDRAYYVYEILKDIAIFEYRCNRLVFSMSPTLDLIKEVGFISEIKFQIFNSDEMTYKKLWGVYYYLDYDLLDKIAQFDVTYLYDVTTVDFID